MIADRRRALCASLKEAREKKGISLDDIAASTKISRALLKGLEASDISRWPSGIYRRSYLREYLRAIDLTPEPVIAEFAQLFPDDVVPLVSTPPLTPDPDEGPLSIMLAEDHPHWLGKAPNRILAATFDAAVLFLAAGAAWWWGWATWWTALAIVAVCYYVVGTAALGRSFGLHCLEDRRWRRPLKSTPEERLDGLFGRFRHINDLPESDDETMTEPIAGMPANAAFLRTPFLP